MTERGQQQPENVLHTYKLDFDIFHLLTVLFVVLKLTGQIDWSWWWVVSPIWIQIALAWGSVLVMGIIGIITLALTYIFVKIPGRRRH